MALWGASRPRLPARRLAGGREQRGVRFRVAELLVALTGPARRKPCGQRAPKEANGSLQQVALDEGVEDAVAQGVRGLDGLPCAHISSALATLARRGSRVPPAPGMMPSLTSGWPNRAEGDATR
jgi:hypothetical protein